VLALAAPGCVLPYAAPALSYVPAYDLQCPSTEVHAFRVDVTRTHDTLKTTSCERCQFTRLSVDGLAKTPVVSRFSWSSGTGHVGPGGEIHTSHTITVRVYRAGYEMIEINSWDQPSGKLIWKPAVNVAGQELALDDLFGLDDGQRRDSRVRELEPGSKSTAHRDALLFGADEYQRLANDLAAKEGSYPALRERLLQKAARLRSLADDKPAVAHAGPKP
jgi:hypothetical protein